MSGPSFENIDRWLFEYVEGNLTKEQEEQLEAFIEANPEFELDLDSWEAAKVEPIAYEFPDQSTLYREEKRKRRVAPFIFAIGTLFTASILWYNLSKDYTTETAQSNESSLKLAKKEVVKNTKSAHNPIKKVLKPNSNLPNNQTAVISIVKNNLVQPSNFGTFIYSKNQQIKNWSPNGNSSIKLELDSLSKIAENNLKNEQSSAEELEMNMLSNDSSGLTLTDSKPNESETNNNIEEVHQVTQISEVKEKKKPKSEKSSSVIDKIAQGISNLSIQKIGLKNTYDHQIHVPGISQLDANFSSAGDVSSTRFRTLSRAQWLGKDNQTLSNQLSLDWYTKSVKSGFGIQGNYQYYGNGVIQHWNAAFIYSPKILVAKGLLIEPAVRFKMGSKILSTNKVTGISQVEIDRNNNIDFYSNGSIPIGKYQWYRDLGTSILMHSKWFYLGGQIDNILRHQDNIYETNISNPRRAGYAFRVHAGTEYVSKNGKTSFNPYFFYEKFEKLEENWVGFNFQHKYVAIGGAISNRSNYVVSAGLRFQTFSFTYQFDRTKSEIMGAKIASHQLGFAFNTKVSRSSRRYIHLN